VFVNGCFWHGHEGCPRATLPKRNREFWAEKIASNQARDKAKEAALVKLGFVVATVWECEIELTAGAITIEPNSASALREICQLKRA